MFECLFQGAAEFARAMPEAFYAYTINQLFEFQSAKLFLNYPVRNFTFDGIEDEIMKGINEGFPMNFSLPIPFDKFGWFYDVRFTNRRTVKHMLTPV